jgi:hypothetical protein
VGYLGQVLGAEDQKGDDEDDQQFHAAYTGHDALLFPAGGFAPGEKV